MNNLDIESKLYEAERKALDSLSRYKFMQFGYWAAIWVHLNKLSHKKHKSPFKIFVNLAKDINCNKPTNLHKQLL